MMSWAARWLRLGAHIYGVLPQLPALGPSVVLAVGPPLRAHERPCAGLWAQLLPALLLTSAILTETVE